MIPFCSFKCEYPIIVVTPAVTHSLNTLGLFPDRRRNLPMRPESVRAVTVTTNIRSEHKGGELLVQSSEENHLVNTGSAPP